MNVSACTYVNCFTNSNACINVNDCTYVKGCTMVKVCTCVNVCSNDNEVHVDAGIRYYVLYLSQRLLHVCRLCTIFQ